MEARYELMSAYLMKAVERAGIGIPHLASELGYRAPGSVRRWIEGGSLPRLSDLVPLANSLRVDVRELALGWQMVNEPSLGAPLRTLIALAGLEFPE